MIRITNNISIPDEEIAEEFTRSSGPGGQHVNKTETAVQLRFDAARSQSIPEPVRERLLKSAGDRATTDGVIIIRAQRFRSQDRNRHDARERLAEMIRRAAQPPKKRRKTKPSRASKRRRLEGKRRQSEKKQQRRSVSRGDD